MLGTITSPVFHAISVPIKDKGVIRDYKEDKLPHDNWTDVDGRLYGLLVRSRVRNPSLTFGMRITQCELNKAGDPPSIYLLGFLPEFQVTGGPVVFLSGE